MATDLRISNYRCFSSRKPLDIRLDAGFKAYVGLNNSGKSTILKFFHDFRHIFSLFAINTDEFRSALVGNELAFPQPAAVLDLEEIFFNENDEDLSIEVALSNVADGDTVTKATINLSRATRRYTVTFSRSGAVIQGQQMKKENYEIQGTKVVADRVYQFKDVLEAFTTLSRAYYVPAFRHLTAYSPTTQSGGNLLYYDINVGRPFIDVWDQLQNGTRQSDRERIYQLVRELKSVFGFDELQITASQGHHTLNVAIDGKSYPLQDLGAGIAQFIAVLGNAAFKRPSYILIDEPELNLHPTLQVQFLTTLAAYASDGVLFATHNIGLAREVADEIYSVTNSRKGTEVLPIGENIRLGELLGELNYSGYRELGFDKVLLVEGRTDVRTYIEFLRVLGKDHQFLVVPLGGAGFINADCREELQELTRISPNCFCVIDSEKQAAADAVAQPRAAFAQICTDLNINCRILERRATENYFPNRAVKAAFGNGFRAFGDFELRNQMPNCWPKAHNWRAARLISKDELLATDLGQFLQAI
ncbi:MAG: AAA family ATPase [Acidobacteriia bacterium]|nr:AAA family ATPase [Terriglobia bacterium]